MIDAYEGILTNKRAAEKDLLNAQRFLEHEQNRAP